MPDPDQSNPSLPVPTHLLDKGRQSARSPLRNSDGLSKRHMKAVEALLQEPTITRAAGLAGVNERTLRRWMDEPAFKRAYHKARRESYGQAIGLLQRYAPVAVSTLVQVMSDTKVPPAARVAASVMLLKFGKEGIELEDLAQRIEALEQTVECENSRRGSY